MTIENISGINESLGEIGLRIRDLRIASCYTQSDLAKKAGISVSSIHRIEQGQSVQFDNILSVLKALNLLSRMEIAVPVQRVSPMQQLKGVQKKKTYRRPKQGNGATWEWGE